MNKIIVVEGYHDLAKLKEIDDNLFVMITNGSAVSKELINNLKELEKTYEIILLLDPDFPGEKIRKTLQNELTNVSHIFVDKKDCINKNKTKVGIEHMNKEVLREKMADVISTNKATTLTFSDLYELRLTGHMNSSRLRDWASSRYNIGSNNAKTLLERLNWLSVTKQELQQLLLGGLDA